MNSIVPSVTLYQPPWWHFLNMAAYSVGKDVATTSFLSFEDALWSLCHAEGLEPGSIFLIPEFYCMDVVAQIEARGWQVAWYSFSSAWTVQEESFYQQINELKPAVVILYHPFGKSSLSLSPDSPLCSLAETLLIEDCAHCLLKPSEVAIHGDSHVVIDSLRKVSPFQGSRIFSKRERISLLESRCGSFHRYYLVALYQIWRFFLFLSSCFKLASLWQISEALFMRYNDGIGTAPHALRAPMSTRYVVPFLDVPRIRAKKYEFVSCYASLLQEFSEYLIEIPENQWQELKCFPMLLPTGQGEALVEFLRTRGVDSDIMFAECPASASVVLVMLPLPIHQGQEEIRRITSHVGAFFQGLQVSNDELYSLQENRQ